MHTVAIIPVKSFSRAKSRLALPPARAAEACGLMLREVLRAASEAPEISHIIAVTRDRQAARAASEFGAEVAPDARESGVNQAVRIADRRAGARGADASIVLPQDIVLATPDDIGQIAKMASGRPRAVVVPSRRLDGTNALLRCPHDCMSTRYDEGSYLPQMAQARASGALASLALMRRIMADVDEPSDIRYCLQTREKPALCARLAALAGAKKA